MGVDRGGQRGPPLAPRPLAPRQRQPRALVERGLAARHPTDRGVEPTPSPAARPSRAGAPGPAARGRDRCGGRRDARLRRVDWNGRRRPIVGGARRGKLLDGSARERGVTRRAPRECHGDDDPHSADESPRSAMPSCATARAVPPHTRGSHSQEPPTSARRRATRPRRRILHIPRVIRQSPLGCKSPVGAQPRLNKIFAVLTAIFMGGAADSASSSR